jgi:cytidylate kinase
MSRTIVETLISRQLHQYNRLKSILREDPTAPPPERGPVVTISRMAGCCARDLAAELADRLGVQVWGRELVDLIAGDKGLRREVVAKLDEGVINTVDAWVRGMLGRRLFLRDDYAVALARTVKTLAETGGAVIVGRGAGFILGERADLRLRLVAGDRHRIKILREQQNLSQAEAREIMSRTDAARVAFVRAYFQADVDDHRHYDLVVNTERMDLSVLVEACLQMVAVNRRRTVEAEA